VKAGGPADGEDLLFPAAGDGIDAGDSGRRIGGDPGARVRFRDLVLAHAQACLPGHAIHEGVLAVEGRELEALGLILAGQGRQGAVCGQPGRNAKRVRAAAVEVGTARVKNREEIDRAAASASSAGTQTASGQC